MHSETGLGETASTASPFPLLLFLSAIDPEKLAKSAAESQLLGSYFLWGESPGWLSSVLKTLFSGLLKIGRLDVFYGFHGSRWSNPENFRHFVWK